VTYYSLLFSGSNEVISIFEWDEIASGSITGSILFPSGTYIQEVSASSSFTSSADYTNFTNVGIYGGFFSGSVYVSEYDTFNINNIFVLYQPSASNTGSINISTTGSLNVSGSVTSNQFTGSFSGSFNGYLYGTASYALTASVALTTVSASYAQTASYAFTASHVLNLNQTNIELFKTSSNWTKPSWAKTVKVILIGGGGAGGSAYGLSNSNYERGGGGGAGGSLTTIEFDASTLPTSSISVFVGGGGFRGQNGSDGGNGGTSQFGDYAHAPGGQGGQGVLTGRIKPTQTNLLLGGIASPYKVYSSAGGGPGGAGSVLNEEYIPFLPFNNLELFKCAIAPSLPYDDIYLRANPMYLVPGQTNGWNGSLNVPATIAPTGGGGGLGYETAASGSGGQDGETWGGSIIIGTLDINNREWNIRFGDKFYPAYYTQIGLGGMGGVPSGSQGPQSGTSYGGGGGGAYAGGTQYSSDPFETTYNDGADGAPGIVVIISEA